MIEIKSSIPMATKIQLEAMIKKILELQYYGETAQMITLDPLYVIIHTADGNNYSIDTDGRDEKWKN